MFGKNLRLERITTKNKAVILAFDHGFEHGPVPYTGIDISPKRILDIAVNGGADALMVHKGQLDMDDPKKFRDLGLIVKISGRSNLSPKDSEIQEVVTTVEDAIAFGADAIATTVYIGANKEPEMLESFSLVYHACMDYGMPLIGFMYPRGANVKKKTDEAVVRYAARVGSELGCDLIKTYYTGSRESWQRVVKDAFKPVVAAGGEVKPDIKSVYKMVEDACSAGGAGVAMGRNVWEREDAVKVLKGICSIVHNGKTAAEALKKV